jgi:hypothetical protein
MTPPAIRSATTRDAVPPCSTREARAVDAVVLWPTPASRTLYLRHGFAVREDLMERRLWRSPDHRGEP